jgi:hypothetical protein
MPLKEEVQKEEDTNQSLKETDSGKRPTDAGYQTAQGGTRLSWPFRDRPSVSIVESSKEIVQASIIPG